MKSSSRKSATPEPTWDVALLFPPQGAWSEEEYLALDSNRLIEFADGFLEVLPMPTTEHQLLVAYLYRLLAAFVLVTKRREYARAGIADYWMVDPQTKQITVLRLSGKRYVVQGKYASGERAASQLLRGFGVEVSEVFAQARLAGE